MTFAGKGDKRQTEIAWVGGHGRPISVCIERADLPLKHAGNVHAIVVEIARKTEHASLSL